MTLRNNPGTDSCPVMAGMTTTTPHPGPPPSPSPSTSDYLDPQTVIKVFDQAAAANLNSPLRRGATVHLPNHGRLVMTGDLHDHGVNLQRILKLARLDESPDHHLVLHEVIHGQRRVNGADMSILTLARIAAMKLRFPDQVHLMQSNHELAQIGGEGISKGGHDVAKIFDEGLDFIYESSVKAVRNALARYIRSLVLAVKCANGVFTSHSLPSAHAMRRFDPTVIDRVPTDVDLSFKGSAYDLVWGRRHGQKIADVLAKSWNTRLFVLGHQAAQDGHFAQGESMLIIDSSHDDGVALPIDLAKTYTRDELIDQLVPLASVVAEPVST